MVIGNGLIAKIFQGYKSKNDFLIFASGVSDSKSGDKNDFYREYNLLLKSIRENFGKKIVYFSTSSIFDADLKETPYVKHKMSLENLIRENTSSYTIFRLSNLAGFSNNPNTILNFFYFHIVNGRHFDLWKNSERNIIDVEDAYRVMDYALQNNLFENEIVNIANKNNYPVNYIVNTIETFVNLKAIFTKKEKGAKISIDISTVKPLFELLKIEFEENYLSRLLVKYYPKHDI
ncbi:MAG TPA: NAD-dependent epimerase/dehydratase family protein [Puia sp.]